jgi:lipopolysaccharide/colanic/teichoic acid biosynthesis glycosyltransferase
VGAMIHRLYLDELPQLLNILRGEMSFVGPRPERRRYTQGGNAASRSESPRHVTLAFRRRRSVL